jgi:MYXO-CTERM domain-containing protein
MVWHDLAAIHECAGGIAPWQSGMLFLATNPTVVMRAYDLAGNFSDSDPLALQLNCPDPWPADAGPAPGVDAGHAPVDAGGVPVDAADSGGCGCRAARGRGDRVHPFGWLLLAAAAFALIASSRASRS